MIIFGTRGITYTKERGSFFCPQCEDEQPYDRKRVRRFFTLYFVPVIPLDMVAEYIECPACGGTFRDEVLSYDPREAIKAFQAHFHETVRRTMIHMMLADGDITDAEVATIRDLYGKLIGAEVPESQIRSDMDRVRRNGVDLFSDLREVAPQLNEHGKEMVVRAALMVAAADEKIHEQEDKLLRRIAEALEMSPAHFRGIAVETEKRNE